MTELELLKEELVYCEMRLDNLPAYLAHIRYDWIDRINRVKEKIKELDESEQI